MRLLEEEEERQEARQVKFLVKVTDDVE